MLSGATLQKVSLAVSEPQIRAIAPTATSGGGPQFARAQLECTDDVASPLRRRRSYSGFFVGDVWCETQSILGTRQRRKLFRVALRVRVVLRAFICVISRVRGSGIVFQYVRRGRG